MELHILVLDDDQDTREMVQLLLQVAGFSVSVSGNSADALCLASEQQFDAFLIDNWMPDMTGIELCRKIRVFDQLTPILVCSGAALQADIEAATSTGAQGYVTKPFDPDDLINALHTVIQTS